MKILQLLVAPFGLVLLTTGCESKPCSGGGMKVDDRALPEAWEATAPALPGAIACVEDQPSGGSEWSRSYEFGADAHDGNAKWTAHLTGKGWKDTGGIVDDDIFVQTTFEREGHKIELKCSRMVEDKGWCTLQFTPKPG